MNDDVKQQPTSAQLGECAARGITEEELLLGNQKLIKLEPINPDITAMSPGELKTHLDWLRRRSTKPRI